MYPQTHFLAGLAAGEAAAGFGVLSQPEALLVAGLATAVDIDHYLYFAFKHKALSLKKAWDAAITRKEQGERTLIHHYIGFIIVSAFLIGLAYFYPKWALILALAYYSHYLLDHLPVGKRKLSFQFLGVKFNMGRGEVWLDIALILCVLFLLVL